MSKLDLNFGYKTQFKTKLCCHSTFAHQLGYIAKFGVKTSWKISLSKKINVNEWLIVQWRIHTMVFNEVLSQFILNLAK